MMGPPDFELIEEPKSAFVYLILEVCIMAVIKDNESAEIPTRNEFFSSQSTDVCCRAAFVCTSNTRALVITPTVTKC